MYKFVWSKSKYMKINSFISLVVLLFIGMVTANAQECGFYSMSKGTMFSYQNLDAKGKIASTSRLECVGSNISGITNIYNLHSTFFDAKNKETMDQDYDMRCEGGNFYVDMKQMLNPATMSGVKDMEVSVNSSEVLYPANISTGMTLPDANITVTAASNGMVLMNISVAIFNRKVVGNESVTVPAGTFDCYKITYDIETKMLFKITATAAEYMNAKVGLVKSESFDKKGKLVGSTVLTEYKK